MANLSRVGTAGFLAALAAVLLAAASDRAMRPYVQGALAASADELELRWWGWLAIAAVVAAAGSGLARYGARLATVASLATLALVDVSCGFAPSAGWYAAGRHLQLAATAVVLAGLISWVLPGFDPRRWGLLLAAFYLAIWPGVAAAVGLAQYVVLDNASWHVVLFAVAALAAVSAVAAIWLPGPVPETDPARRISGVFGADQPTTDVNRPRRRLPSLVMAGGFAVAVLLTRLSNQIMPVDPQTLDAKVRLEMLPVYGQALAIATLAVLALRVRPDRLGAASCGLLFCGCVALAAGLVDLEGLDPPMTRSVAQAVAVAAQFAFALAALRVGRCSLATSAVIVVAAAPLAWGIWDLLQTVRLIDEPGTRDRVIAMGLAAIGVLAGLADRGRGVG